jgi:plasmid stabilization system protein ParE
MAKFIDGADGSELIPIRWSRTKPLRGRNAFLGKESTRGSVMPRGSKSKYTSKQKRKAEHIEEGYEKRGTSKKEAERRAWATVNKSDKGGKKSGSGRGKKSSKSSSRKGGRKGGKKSSGRKKRR